MRSVDNAFRLLKIENYAYLREPPVRVWLQKNWPWLGVAALCVIGLILHS